MLQLLFVFNPQTLWHLLIPAAVLGLLLPSYFFLKKKKAEASDEEDEDFFG